MPRPDPRAGRRHRAFLAVAHIAVSALALTLVGCGPDYPQSTIDPVSDFGAAIQGLYRQVFWWSMVILALVWAVLAYVLIRFRARADGPQPSRTRGHLGLEIGWTIGAAVIVVLISIPTVQAVWRTQRAPPGDALVIEVIGHQWWWEMRYPAQEVVTANEMHVPVGRPVELRLRSADIIHSFWVPRIGGKRDLNPWVRDPDQGGPGYNRIKFVLSEPGIYHGQCAEFCGASHALMGLRVVGESEADFERWLQQMNTPVAPASGTLADEGRQIFLRSTCIACHTIEGTSARGTLGPDLTRLGARTTIAAGVLENTPENLAAWIENPASVKPGVKMPGTQEGGGGMPATGLTDEQVAAVAAYLSSLR